MPSGTKQDPWQLSTAPAWLVEQRDLVDLGAADELKPAKEGTVEAFGRSADNPVGGWYGLRKGYRGRFGVYVPPLLEALGRAELTHDPRNNRSARSRPAHRVAPLGEHRKSARLPIGGAMSGPRPSVREE
ncbi:MAG TPA: hypothetical protein VE476_17550 [Propionibacteriaceae bacterium]|nr:hypothetical protein [Propionibacteriaceae bacterium]